MKLFADENIARAIITRLRDQGHDVLFASEIEPGAADPQSLSRAEAQSRIVLTADKDFGNLIFRDRLTSHGVVLLRLGDMPLADRFARLEQAWPVIESRAAGRFIVITGAKIRVRHLLTTRAP